MHFVVPDHFSDQLTQLPDQIIGVDYPYWLGGRFNWVAQSYLVLRQYREGLTIGTSPMAKAVNFAHVMGWRSMGPRQGEYRVSVRADYPKMFDVDFEMLQNPVAPMRANQAYLPYWPVPGIVPRDEARTGIKRVAYAGRMGARNLADPIKKETDPFEGLEFAIIDPDHWHDMSKVDLLVAIRDFSGAAHDNKPPSKLFNAWIAGIPLIGGTDTAFSSVGVAGEDYIRVQNEAELQAAVSRLREDERFYQSIVKAGRQRAHDVSHAAIAQDWLRVLEGPVQTDFERWLSSGGRASIVPPLLDKGREAASRLKSHLKGRG